MASFKKVMKNIGKGAITILGLAGVGTIYTAASCCGTNLNYDKNAYRASFGNESYSEAINAISKSSMNDYYKHRLIGTVRKYEADYYYRAIISIVNSSMNDYFKFDAIKDLNG